MEEFRAASQKLGDGVGVKSLMQSTGLGIIVGQLTAKRGKGMLDVEETPTTKQENGCYKLLLCMRFLKFACLLCRKVLSVPVTTPCGHNFCKSCLEGAFSGKSFIKKRGSEGGRTLRA
ncbi:hypothetical protein HN51_054991 [Arachis hypogaea]